MSGQHIFGQVNGNYVKRPIEKFYPLEVQDEVDNNDKAEAAIKPKSPKPSNSRNLLTMI